MSTAKERRRSGETTTQLAMHLLDPPVDCEAHEPLSPSTISEVEATSALSCSMDFGRAFPVVYADAPARCHGVDQLAGVAHLCPSTESEAWSVTKSNWRVVVAAHDRAASVRDALGQGDIEPVPCDKLP